MAVISVFNQKGGVGKTTLAVHIAAALGLDLIDADPQGSAAAWAEPGLLPIKTVQPDDVVSYVRSVSGDVVVDMPPAVSDLTARLLLLSDLVLIPVTASALDIAATADALRLLEEARQARPIKALLIPNRVDRRTGSGQVLEGELVGFGEPVAPAIGYRTAFADAAAAGVWVSKGAGGAEVRSVAAVVAGMMKTKGRT